MRAVRAGRPGPAGDLDPAVLERHGIPFCFWEPAARGATAEPSRVFAISPQEVVDDVYDLLEAAHRVFGECGIPYLVSGGTQLGAVRHGGLIPWDDDADVMIQTRSDNDLVQRAIPRLRELGFETHGCYRRTRTKEGEPQDRFAFFFMFKKNGRIIPGRDTPYPSLDIFSFTNSSVDGLGYLQPAYAGVRDHWPDWRLKLDGWERRAPMDFGHLRLSALAPSDAARHLTALYGSDWQDWAYTNPIDHQGGGAVKQVKMPLNRETRAPARSTRDPAHDPAKADEVGRLIEAAVRRASLAVEQPR